MPDHAAPTPPTPPTPLPALRHGAAQNAAGCAGLARCAAAALAVLDHQVEAQAGHRSALAGLAQQLGALMSTAQVMALELEQQQWLAQGAMNLAVEARPATAEAARASHEAAQAAEALAVTLSGLEAHEQNDDRGSALAREARNALDAGIEVARALAELDRSAHAAGLAGAQLLGHPAAAAAGQAQALAQQLTAGLVTAHKLATEHAAASGDMLARLRRQRADRAIDQHRARAQQAGWQNLLDALPAHSPDATESTAPSVSDPPWETATDAARAAEAVAKATHTHQQAACSMAQARQAEALALQQALQAPEWSARALAPAVQAAVQAAQEALPWARDLPARCASALTLAGRAQAAGHAAAQALQGLEAAHQRAQAHGGHPSAAFDKALAQAVQDLGATGAALATALAQLANALRSAGQAAAAAETLVTEAGAGPAGDVELLAQLNRLVQSQDLAVQAHGQAVATAVTAAAQAQAALVHAQGQAAAAAAAQAAAQQA